jgi:adenylate kinase
MKKLVFIGPQGSGKGTQAKIIAERLGLCHISTGDLLRKTSGDLGEKVRALIDKGHMVPDDMILELLQERLKQPDCSEGYILDGYPRNIAQAETLDKTLGMGTILEIHISDNEAIRRLSGRWNCPDCGAIYNVNTAPVPEEEDVCDKCKGRLYQREDDTEEAIRKRLEIYHASTEPIITKYDSIRINGEQSIEKVTEDILQVLNS